MSYTIKNKVALITGAASGIGRSTAKLFARQGAITIVSDINEEKGLKLINEINDDQGEAHFIHLDVTQESAWQKTLLAIQDQHKQLNILVNNAGIWMAKSLAETTFDNWRNLMAVNLDGIFLGVKYAIPLMCRTEGNSIINLSSALGITSNPVAAAYSASKGAVRLFTKAAALECAKTKPFAVRVNSVHPGVVRTSIFNNLPWWNQLIQENGSEEGAWDALAKNVPIGRNATAHEIAESILFLASSASTYMTGSELIIDGGYTAQ